MRCPLRVVRSLPHRGAAPAPSATPRLSLGVPGSPPRVQRQRRSACRMQCAAVVDGLGPSPKAIKTIQRAPRSACKCLTLSTSAKTA
eukprot:10826212-Alexandrium_andersonii.AAC.1